MRLYLIRHGQTEWNSSGLIQGKTDIPLNATGICQAERLADAMEKKSVTAVYSSPLQRAWETAAAVAKRQGLPVVTVPELREVDFGLWEGLNWEEISGKYPDDFAAWDRNPVLNTPTGGEKKESSKNRCRVAMERLLCWAEGDIAIVAHGGILVFVVDYLLQAQKEKNEVIVRNASITTLEYDRQTGVGSMILLNDIGHLADVENGKRNKYC